MKSIIDVKTLEDYKLIISFDNGEKRLFDVEPLLELQVYKPLKDKNLFNKVHVIHDYTIGWIDGIDMCPDSIYLKSVPIA